MTLGKTPDHDTRIAWHPAFYGAMQLELDQYKEVLQFEFEYQLTAEPLKMDILIIKKEKDIKLEKNIASLFRKDNIVEYKSPEDYLSVEDFYKVYGYGCLYGAFNKVPVTDLTLTFVENRYPRELLRHLKDIRGYEVQEAWSGIYHIRGDIIPIQIVVNKKLPEDENMWLKHLTDELDAEQLNGLLAKSSQRWNDSRMKTYIYAILQANSGMLREVLQMGNAAITLEEVLEEAGLTAKWEAKGEARGEVRGEARGENKKTMEILAKGLERGMDIQDISYLTGYSPEFIAEYKQNRERTR
jgi:hypothetical protein